MYSIETGLFNGALNEFLYIREEAEYGTFACTDGAREYVLNIFKKDWNELFQNLNCDDIIVEYVDLSTDDHYSCAVYIRVTDNFIKVFRLSNPEIFVWD